MKTISLLLLTAWFLIGALPLEISAQEKAIAWSELGEKEKAVLGPFRDRWKGLSAFQQRRLQKGARRWADMPADQRRAVSKRFRSWKKISPEKQEKIRSKFRNFQKLPAKKRDQIRRARHWFRNLPKERKEKLRKRWQSIPPEKRPLWRQKRQKKIERLQKNRRKNAPLRRLPRNR